jgi:hypothetical protein
VAGGRRGAAFDEALESLRDRVKLTAICDPSEEVLTRWKVNYPNIATFVSYDALLESGDCTAVFVATPMELHAQQAIRALQAGKHVLSEVTAATTLDECWQLVEAVESTGLAYMLAENYCYMRPNMMVLNMVQQGVFGEITYAEGAYIHDCRDLIFTDEGDITWRGEMRLQYNGNTDPIDGRSPGQIPGEAEWESLWKYSRQYEHPSWREWGEQAGQTGHGGGDFLVLKGFLDAIQTGASPPIDVYDAVTWSSIMPLSIQSVAQGGVPVEIPDFSRGMISVAPMG